MQQPALQQKQEAQQKQKEPTEKGAMAPCHQMQVSPKKAQVERQISSEKMENNNDRNLVITGTSAATTTPRTNVQVRVSVTSGLAASNTSLTSVKSNSLFLKAATGAQPPICPVHNTGNARHAIHHHLHQHSTHHHHHPLQHPVPPHEGAKKSQTELPTSQARSTQTHSGVSIEQLFEDSYSMPPGDARSVHGSLGGRDDDAISNSGSFTPNATGLSFKRGLQMQRASTAGGQRRLVKVSYIIARLLSIEYM